VAFQVNRAYETVVLTGDERMNTRPDDLKKLRDEVKLKIHLGTMEVKDEWEELEKKWDQFTRDTDLEKTAEGLGDATKGLTAELQKGYERLRKAL